MITTLDELKNAMSVKTDATTEQIQSTFEDIASFLMNKCSIEYRVTKYRFIDLEFYYFSDKHRDISVHPRNSNALSWYINDFGGIDLNFESKIEKIKVENNKKISFRYLLTEDSYFGGILIRQLKNLSTGDTLDGPWKVAELFRELDALSKIQNNPILRLDKHDHIEPTKSTRRNLLGASKNPYTKAESNLDLCFTNSYLDTTTLGKELEDFNNELYRFTIQLP